MVVTQPTSRKILGINQRTYQSLKLALTLPLRRQLLIAVCDNTVLQNQLASQLETDIAQATIRGNRAEDAFQQHFTQLTHLRLEADHPDLIAQVAQWLKQQPQNSMSSLQVLGIEQMTRQSLMLQHHFLQSLDKIDRLLPHLEASLLIWLPWPWFRAIQQSAPHFWQWRSGVFEFVGDPTPITTLDASPQPQPEALHQAIQFTQLPQSPLSTGLYGEASSLPGHAPAPPIPPARRPQQASADLWTLLSEDLAKFEQSVSETSGQGTEVETIDPPDRDPPITPGKASSPGEQVAPDLPSGENSQPVSLEPPQGEGTVAETAVTPEPSDFPQNPLEKLAHLNRDQASPEEMAQAYLALGHYYREQIEAGHTTAKLVQSATDAYEEGLRWLTDTDPAWGTGLNDLGTLYWMQAQQQQSREQLLAGMYRSVETYQRGLTKVNQKLQPDIASRLHSNLGAVYSTLAAYENAAENLRQSVNAYRQALPLCNPEQNAEEYATLQNSLGSVYWKLSHYEQPKSCLHRAIAAYNESLRYRHPEKAPLDYAAVQNNLGIAYWSLAKQERPIFLLKHAIAAYRDALNYRTPHTDPAACASTYNNLGTAYWELASQIDQQEDPNNRYQQNAAIAYEAALKAAQQGQSNLDLQSIHHCLANVYEQLAHKGVTADAIALQMQRALNHHLAAIDQLPKSSQNYEPIFNSLVRNIQHHYDLLGITGQQKALNQLPAHLLPEVMQSL
jgi:tetratricopeptide (TPR) repeat protein